MGPISIKLSLKILVLVSLSSCLFITPISAKSDDLDKDEFDSNEEKTEEVVIQEVDYEVQYATPSIPEDAYFAEHFDDEDAKNRWIVSRAHKEEQDNVFKYDGIWDFGLPDRVIFPNDKGLILRSKAKHAAISAKLTRRFDFNTKPLIVQYEVNFQNGMDCGGAYIKLLSYSKDLDLKNFHDKTPYTIMFGPDKCGNDIKMHFIFRHKNPINGTYEEKHSKRPSNRMEETYNDKKPHLYRLILTPDNKFQVFIDSVLVSKGSLLTDMTPPVNPPEEIEDPNDRKPNEWDEREKIPDLTASKPEDWDEDAPAKIKDPNAVKPEGWLEDEPEFVPDETAVKPDDWDDQMDGVWEAPSIPNPKCVGAPGCGPWTVPLVENPNFKGKWKPPMIANPAYKGKWSPRTIPNPQYFEDKEPFKMTSIGAVGLEIWSMTDGVLFDNFLITDDENILEEWTSLTYDKKKRSIDKDSKSMYGRFMRRINYRIGAWSIYFVYCAIPIALYVGYLAKFYYEEGVFGRIISYSNAHPWLWAVYIFVIGLPLVLIFTFCCGSSQDKKTDLHKKTDDVADDDDVISEETAKETQAETKTSKQKLLSSTAKKHSNKVSTSKEELEKKRLDSDDDEEEELEDEQGAGGDSEKSDKEPLIKPAAAGKKTAGSKKIIDLNADAPAPATTKRRPRRE